MLKKNLKTICLLSTLIVVNSFAKIADDKNYEPQIESINKNEAVKINEKEINVGDEIKINENGINIGDEIKINKEGINVGGLIKINEKDINIGDGAISIGENGVYINNTSFTASSKNTGDYYIKNESRNVITGMGDFNLKNVTVNQKTNIIGNLYAENTTLANLLVVGDTAIKNTTINIKAGFIGTTYFKKTTVNSKLSAIGEFTAISSTFKEPINITSGSVYFKNTSAQDIVIFSNPQESSKTEDSKKENSPKPNITLTDNSIVKDIKFSAGNGVVLVKDDSKITGESDRW